MKKIISATDDDIKEDKNLTIGMSKPINQSDKSYKEETKMETKKIKRSKSKSSKSKSSDEGRNLKKVKKAERDHANSQGFSKYTRFDVITESDEAKRELILKKRLNKDGEEMMNIAYQKMIKLKTFNYHAFTQEDFEYSEFLVGFVCWELQTPKRGGICLKGDTEANKYYQVGTSEKNTKYQAHKLSLVRKLQIPYSELENQGKETSHLCHNHKCWNPIHLCAETHIVNTNRNKGIGCRGYIYDRKTKNVYDFCRHEPKCAFVQVEENILDCIVSVNKKKL